VTLTILAGANWGVSKLDQSVVPLQTRTPPIPGLFSNNMSRIAHSHVQLGSMQQREPTIASATCLD